MTQASPGGDPIYLDYNATAPLRPEAFEAVTAALRGVGNPSSDHPAGRAAAAQVDLARRRLAALLDCEPSEIIFTSGATEANNLALRTVYGHGGRPVTTAVEHPSVLETARTLTRGAPDRLTVLPVDANGLVDLAGCTRRWRPPPGGA